MITASINVAPLMAKLQRLGLATKQPMHALVREQAKLFVSSSGNVPGIVQITPPNSDSTRGTAAKKQGENKTRRDIRRVYGLPSDMYAIIKAKDPKVAAAYWGMVRERKWDQASALAQRMTGTPLRDFDGGGAHRSRRQNGVVSKGNPSMFLRDPVGKSGELQRYIDKKIKNVGIYASGFNAAGALLGAKGIPSWALRHGTTFSGVSVQEGPTSFYITISDRVPFGQADTVRRMRYVLDYRSKALSRAMPFIIRKAMKSVGFAATTT